MSRKKASSPTGGASRDASREPGPPAVRRHMRFGWAALLAFLALGLVLEGLHGLKVGWYLDLASSTRRLMFTLAHAHGTLLALLNIAYALTIPRVPAAATKTASSWLIAGSLLMPVGFLVGGVVTYGGDPNPGIALAAVGGVVLLVAVAAIVRSLFRSP